MSQQASPADHSAGQPLWEHSRVLDSNPMQDSSHTLSLNEFLHALSKFSSDGKLASSENCSRPPCSSQTVTPKYGDAGAMGLAGFALSTFVLSVCNTGQLSSGVSEVVLPVALWYGGFVQLFAGLWEVYLGNTFGATVFSSYGAFWLSYATFIKFVVPDYESAVAAGTVSVDDINHAVGLFLLSWLFFSSFMTIAAYKVNRAVFVIFLLLVPTLILLTAGAYAGRNEITKVGGWVGIMCSFSAWYVMASKVINGTWKKIILPLGEDKV